MPFTYLGVPYWQWTSFERGFDTPEAYKVIQRVGFNLPRCEQCQDFPERFEVGQFIHPIIHKASGKVVQNVLLDREVRVECHGKRFSVNGPQAEQLLAAMYPEGYGH